MRLKINIRKIKCETLIFYLLIIIILIDHDLFWIFKINSTILNYVQLFAAIGAFGLVFFSHRRKKIKYNMRRVKWYLFITVLFLVCQCVYTQITYREQTTSAFFSLGINYVWIILVWPIMYLFSTSVEAEHFFDTIKRVVVIAMIIMFCHAFFYNSFSIEIFSISFYKPYGSRNGRLRIWDLSSFEGFAVIWAFFEILRRKRVLANIIYIVIILGTMIYVEQARMMLICIILAVASMYISNSGKQGYSLLLKIVLIISTVSVFLFGDIIGRLFESFSLTGNYAGSTRIRLAEWSYALELYFAHPINGMGLIFNDVRDQYINYRASSHFAYSDIGIIGLLAQIGSWTYIIYCVPICRFLYITIREKSKSVYYVFMLGLIIYLLATSGSILVLNNVRCMLWPICFCTFLIGRTRAGSLYTVKAG